MIIAVLKNKTLGYPNVLFFFGMEVAINFIATR